MRAFHLSHHPLPAPVDRHDARPHRAGAAPWFVLALVAFVAALFTS
jgi:hypothetical protein